MCLYPAQFRAVRVRFAGERQHQVIQVVHARVAFAAHRVAVVQFQLPPRIAIDVGAAVAVRN